LHVSLLAGFRELLTSPLVSWSTGISFWFLVNGVDVLTNALGLVIVLDTHSRWLRVLMSLAAWFPWIALGLVVPSGWSCVSRRMDESRNTASHAIEGIARLRRSG
jgi:hypothetical protein